LFFWQLTDWVLQALSEITEVLKLIVSYASRP